ncbi:GRASP-like protein [Mya arenaria]|uniref:GRASP-like protein n=1 Tax=Mya arenaria TaxID=6604 RepID=A0ABY7EJG3_MYAAR|nr:GRASP-like protein [Mya arenaria]
MGKRVSVGSELEHLEFDKAITTDPSDNLKRRTLQLTRSDRKKSWGFTLQTYGITHKLTSDTEIMTYVDYVELDGLAYLAGMRKGDVIVSVNGNKVGVINHQQLVAQIRLAGDKLRLVVLFEDCCRKVDLHERFIRLKIFVKPLAYRGLYALGWSSASLMSCSVGDNSSIMEGDYEYMDNSLDSANSSFAMDGMTMYASDSNLVRATGASNFHEPLQGQKSKLRNMRLSDSTLYRSSRGVEKDLLKSTLKTKAKFKIGQDFTDGGVQSLKDDVFEDEKLATNQVGRSDSVRTVSDVTLKEHTVYYAGENGTMIVPKICIEGEEVFTTFEHIDTSEVPIKGTELSDGLVNYQEKIVAIEIAKGMAMLENTAESEKLDISDENIPDAFAKSLNSISSPKHSPNSSPKGSPSLSAKYSPDSCVKLKSALKGASSKSSGYQNSVSQSSQLTQQNGALKGKNSAELSKKGSVASLDKMSPKLGRCLNTLQNKGSSIPYDQLKSSIPDTRVSFHTDNIEVIYFNDKDEVTKL